ncbi:hypothetical protein HY416_03275 [Candidatus Kaiserbacteria bacterium]|nr:hypothetical protein [Candidatus Kaiserbacteria bacterium]
MNDTAKQLAAVFHLSAYEARLYMAALDEMDGTVSDLAERAAIPRTAVYPPLKALIAKGFITALKSHRKHTRYRAIEPKYLEHIFERRRVDLKDIIGRFSQGISNDSGEMRVQYFEGRGGVETAVEIFLSEAKSKVWKTFENPAYAEYFFGSRYFEDYVDRRVAKGIRCRVVIPSREHTPWMKQIMAVAEEKLLDIRIVSPELYPIEATIAVGGDWILAVSVQQRPFAIIVKNVPLARTLKSLHDMVWDRFAA